MNISGRAAFSVKNLKKRGGDKDMSKEHGQLTNEQAMSSKGCGVGTEKACFALTAGAEGFECSMITNPQVAQMAGISLGWRVNIDEKDQKAWCPLGVLKNSKTG